VTQTSPNEVAARLAHEFRRQTRRWKKTRGVRLDFLRINGTGDLLPALVSVLNIFAAANPSVKLWIVTRQFDLAARINPLPNVFVQLSLDASTPSNLVETARAIVANNPRAYTSFLRTKADDDTQGAAIVFNEKRTKGLPYFRSTDCPVDAGRMPLNNVRGQGGDACAKCRKCFSENTLTRQREVSVDAVRSTSVSPMTHRHLPVIEDNQ